MGATVTTGKHIAAIRTESGKILYILREQTYEKNCHPHTPHWSCVHIGYLTDVIEAIFKFGSSCEGGMLQNRNGHMTPEGYIAGWLKLLEAPAEQTDAALEFRTGSSFYDAIQPSQVDDALRVLENLGRPDLMQCVRNAQSFFLSLECDADILMTLYKGASLSAWRIIRQGNPPIGDFNSSLGYAPAAAKIGTFELPTFIRIDNEARLMHHPDGTWTSEGWAYSIVGHYVAQYAKLEEAEPGSYKKRIKTFREAVKSAPLVRKGVVLRVYTNRPYQSEYNGYDAKAVDAVQREFPHELTADGFEIRLTDDMDVYRLIHLPAYLVEWRVAHARESCNKPQTMDLFAHAA